MIRDGSILIWGMPEKWNLIAEAIKFFTGKPYPHAAIFWSGCTYEETNGGAKRTEGVKDCTEIWEPETPMTDREWMRMAIYLEGAIGQKWWYNGLKLLVLAIVYPTRKFWNWIKWVPFDKWTHGAVCSEFVDEAWKAAGRDILPKRQEGLTCPGDLRGLLGFRKI